MAKRKTKVSIRATGRSVAYIQNVSKSGKLSKAAPVVITTVRAGVAPAAKKRKRRK